MKLLDKGRGLFWSSYIATNLDFFCDGLDSISQAFASSSKEGKKDSQKLFVFWGPLGKMHKTKHQMFAMSIGHAIKRASGKLKLVLGHLAW